MSKRGAHASHHVHSKLQMNTVADEGGVGRSQLSQRARISRLMCALVRCSWPYFGVDGGDRHADERARAKATRLVDRARSVWPFGGEPRHVVALNAGASSPSASRIVADATSAHDEFAMVAEVFGLDRRGLEHVDYELTTCRAEPGPLRTSHGLRIAPDGGLEELVGADTVIVPGWRDVRERPPQRLLDALAAAHRDGARVVGICSGAFARTCRPAQRSGGHHPLAVRRRVPSAVPTHQSGPDPLYIFGDNNTATSAGSSAGLDLCLAIVGADHTSSDAARIAQRMVVTYQRPGTQAQFVPNDPPTIVADGPLGELLAWIDANLAGALNVDVLPRRAHLSRRTLIRRFRDSTGTTPMAWVAQRRVQHARRLLETSRLSVRQIARMSGLGSVANLRNHLGRVTGLTPTQYRRTHHELRDPHRV
ncbi:hypothetical protein BH23ACT10_BH23ACT10_28680 [soil metagenome]